MMIHNKLFHAIFLTAIVVSIHMQIIQERLFVNIADRVTIQLAVQVVFFVRLHAVVAGVMFTILRLM